MGEHTRGPKKRTYLGSHSLALQNVQTATNPQEISKTVTAMVQIADRFGFAPPQIENRVKCPEIAGSWPDRYTSIGKSGHIWVRTAAGLGGVEKRESTMISNALCQELWSQLLQSGIVRPDGAGDLKE